jgi:restriction system protein
MAAYESIKAVHSVLYKMKIHCIIESIDSKADLLYLHHRDFLNVVAEVFRRKGYKVRYTDRCGEEGNGLVLNDLQYAEVWKHSLNKTVDVEAAMKFTWCMESNSIYRGIFVTLGDFKQSTRIFCHKNVIECINGEQLLAMCREAKRRKSILQAGQGAG